jgi:glycosyltransferase involved in cell wall biosynthesis
MPERPLITFGLITFNQENFVRDAVRAAFAQNYSTLEIILSDDCSTDRTWPILQEMAAEYRGPHRVVLNQNPQNLGLGSHINRLVFLARGELVLAAAGDDISCPERAAKIQAAWESSGRKAMALTSHVKKIDAEGHELGELRTQIHQENRRLLHRARRGCWDVLGCSEAWHRKVFQTFGPLQEYVTAEDRAIEFRALALGPVVLIDDYLVRYRVHGANLAALAHNRPRAERIRMRDRILRINHAMFRQFLVDLDRAEALKLHSSRELHQARQALVRNLRNIELEEDYLAASPGRQLILAFRALWRIGLRTAVWWMVQTLGAPRS